MLEVVGAPSRRIADVSLWNDSYVVGYTCDAELVRLDGENRANEPSKEGGDRRKS